MKALALALVSLLGAGAAQASCAPDAAEMRGAFGKVRFRVDIADDPAERARGLMNVAQMPKFYGMLFVYEQPQAVSFWMRNTLIPLDMIFLGADGVVRKVHENAVPLDETPIPGGQDILAVLELNGGMARQLGIDEGDELRHPQMPQDAAAWACGE